MNLGQIPIKAHPSINKPGKRGDFGIRIKKDSWKMLIPSDLYNLIIVDSGAQTAMAAMKYLHDHQPRIARFLKWTEKEVQAAWHELLAHVNGALNMPEPKTCGNGEHQCGGKGCKKH